MNGSKLIFCSCKLYVSDSAVKTQVCLDDGHKRAGGFLLVPELISIAVRIWKLKKYAGKCCTACMYMCISYDMVASAVWRICDYCTRAIGLSAVDNPQCHIRHVARATIVITNL